MADQKVSELASLTTLAAEDLFYVVDDPNGTPVSKSISVQNAFATVPSNTTFSHVATFSNKVNVSNGIVTLTSSKTVTSNNATTQLGAGMQGSLFWDENYLYIAVSDTKIKRVALSDFTP